MENGFNLEKRLPVALENISVAKWFALPNLSHLVNAMAFVKDKEIEIMISNKYKNSNFKSAKNPNTTHAAGCTYNNVQNTLESIGLM